MWNECGQLGGMTDSKDTNISDYSHKDSNSSKTTIILEIGCSQGCQIRSASSQHSDFGISYLIHRIQQSLGKLKTYGVVNEQFTVFSVAMNMNMNNFLQTLHIYFSIFYASAGQGRSYCKFWIIFIDFSEKLNDFAEVP